MSDDEDCSFKAGMNAFKSHQYPIAIIHFTHTIQKNPENHKAHNALGVTHSKTGNKQDAEFHFQRALLFDPHNPVYEKNLKKVYQDKERVQEPSAQSEKNKITYIKSKYIIGVFLFIGIIFLLFILLTYANIPLGKGMLWENSGEGGLFQSFLQPIIIEERSIPVAEVELKSKKIEFWFDQNQDLSQLVRVQVQVSITDGTKIELPLISTPQKGVYYGFDDPFYGKEKWFALTGYYQDGVPVILAETELNPR